MTDLVERLRIVEPDAPGSKSYCFRNPDGPEAAAEIERLRRENQELKLQYLSDQGQWIEETGRLREALGEKE